MPVQLLIQWWMGWPHREQARSHKGPTVDTDLAQDSGHCGSELARDDGDPANIGLA